MQERAGGGVEDGRSGDRSPISASPVADRGCPSRRRSRRGLVSSSAMTFSMQQGRLPGWRGWLDQLSTGQLWSARRPQPGPTPGIPRRVRPGRQPPAPPPAGRTTGGFELADAREHYLQKKPRFSQRRYLRIEGERMSLCLRKNEWKLGFRLERVARLLHQMHAEATADRSAFRDPDHARRVSGQRHPDAGRSQGCRTFGSRLRPYGAPNAQIMSFCSDQGIECLDLLPAFRREGASRRLYLQRDTHWNRAGNMLAARELSAYLCEGE